MIFYKISPPLEISIILTVSDPVRIFNYTPANKFISLLSTYRLNQLLSYIKALLISFLLFDSAPTRHYFFWANHLFFRTSLCFTTDSYRKIILKYFLYITLVQPYAAFVMRYSFDSFIIWSDCVYFLLGDYLSSWKGLLSFNFGYIIVHSFSFALPNGDKIYFLVRFFYYELSYSNFVLLLTSLVYNLIIVSILDAL
jgi:hypothetical protein